MKVLQTAFRFNPNLFIIFGVSMLFSEAVCFTNGTPMEQIQCHFKCIRVDNFKQYSSTAAVACIQNVMHCSRFWTSFEGCLQPAVVFSVTQMR